MERRRFRCPTCAYCAAQKSTLESHIIRKHRPIRPAVLQAQHKRRRVASSRSNETPQSGGFVSSGDLDAPVEEIEVLVVLSIEVPEAATAPEACVGG